MSLTPRARNQSHTRTTRRSGADAPEVDERLAALCGCRGHPGQQRGEVLLRQPPDPLGDLAHPTI